MQNDDVVEEPIHPESELWDETSPTGSVEISHDSEAVVPVDHLQLYINKLKHYPPLSREEEIELAKKFKETGDKEAAFRLVTSNLMLVVKIAYEFRSQFQNMLDLIQEGNYGLLRAVRKFDPFKGTRLSTYASYWIRAYILKYLLDNWRLVRVGTTNTRRKLLYNLKTIQQKLADSGADAGPKLLAEKFGATERDIIEIQQSLGASDTSLNQPMEEGGKRELVEMMPGGEVDMADDISHRQIMEKFRAAVERFKQGLKPSDLDLLEKRILCDNPLTLREIGETHGVTREAIRQAEERLMKRLKTYLSDELKGAGEVDEIRPDENVKKRKRRTT